MSSAASTTDPAAAAGTTTAGTTTAGTASAPAARTYRLVANSSALTPHVGKKLELTGTLEPGASASPTTTASTDPEANAPILKVQSGKVLAASCTQ